MVPKAHICRFCNHVFSDPSELVTHLLNVEKRDYCKMCDLCSEVFTNKVTYKFHLQKVHHIQQNCPECPICGNFYKSNYFLKRHMNVHTLEKRFPCPMCGARFSQKDNMRSHMKTCKRNTAFQNR